MVRKLRFTTAVLPLALAAVVLMVSGCSKKPTDKQIAAQLQKKLMADAALQGQPISVVVDHGTVTLSGVVSGQGSKELASNDAAQIKGVRSIINNLATQAQGNQPGPNAGDATMNGQPIQSYSTMPPPPQGPSASGPMQGAYSAQPMVIPAGTRIRIQLSQTISTQGNQTGDPFSGTVASPIVVNGQTIVRAGAQANGTVTDVKRLGRFVGQAILAVRLDTVRAGGRTYPVQTSTVERFEKGKGKRTAIITGGGAGLGALIGGLAGGGKGALIGGLLGGGGGAAGSAFTGNRDLVLPAESILTFRLENNVTVR